MKYSYEELVSRFKDFIQTYPDVGEPKYLKPFENMVMEGKKSLYVDFDDIITFDNDVAEHFLSEPDLPFSASVDAMKGIYSETNKDKKLDECHFRVYNLPKTNQVSIRNIRATHVGKLIQLNCMAMIVSDPYPEISQAVFECEKCGEFITVIQDTEVFKTPVTCTSKTCGRNGPFKLMKIYSKFIDHQKIEAIERMEDLTGTTMPRRLPLKLTYDLVDIIKPGQRTIVIGILKTTQQASRTTKTKSTLFSKYIDVNYIATTEEDIENLIPTPEEEEKIKTMVGEEDFIEKYLVRSFCPAIEGNTEAKYATLLALAGADTRVIGATKYRGNSHILLIGDPGQAKSKIIEFANDIIPGSIKTTGKGVSGAGLTASAIQTSDGRWEVQAGALPMAHNRALIVDEFDKMNPDDRDAIHSAMESGEVDIAKAGIIATLLADCPILASANPKGGRFDNNKPFPEQIDLPPTIISRFDLIYQFFDDKDNTEKDRKISNHIIKTWTHGMDYLNQNGELLSEEFLGKYIFYTKKNYHPNIPDAMGDMIREKYLQIRKTSTDGPVRITPRQLQALLRMVCQHARLRQSNTVNEYDVNKVFALWNASMESARDPETGEIDVDMVMTGRPKSQRDKITTIMDIISNLDKKSNNDGAMLKEIFEETRTEGLTDTFTRKIIDELKQKGDAYEPRPDRLKLTLI